MSDRSKLVRVLNMALRDSRKPAGSMLHPNVDLPRITVFDPPRKRRNKVRLQPTSKQKETDIARRQLTLL